MAAATTIGVTIAGCSSSSTTETEDGGSDGDDSTGGGGDDSSGEEWQSTDTVEMTDELVYAPKRIEVEAGTTVTWENTGNIGHTVTAYDDGIPDDAAYFASGGYDSQDAAVDGYESEQGGNIESGETWEYTFETTGTYEYYCIPHEMNGMIGHVKVV